jgi:hypothetical protein
MPADHNHRSQELDLGNSTDDLQPRSDKLKLAARQVIGYHWIPVIRPDRHDSGRDVALYRELGSPAFGASKRAHG